VPVAEGSFDLGGGAKLEVTETLGHASHNLSFFETFNNGVFPGDAAGTYFPEFDVVIPTTPPPFRLDVALASLDKLISPQPTALYYSHFGKATDAVERLKTYKVQLQLWGRIASEGVQEKQSFEKICERILQEDLVMHRLEGFLEAHPVYSITALGNTVQGFVEYAKTQQNSSS
jgi:glyoxylase-like metal-dependent hydrolase (beta-lactamase superfamily II)